MVIKQGHLLIHDNFTIGGAQEGPFAPGKIGIVFRDDDYQGTTMEEFSQTDIFLVSEEQIDQIIKVLTEMKGSKIHLPTDADLAAMRKVH
jgi:phenylalanyl-tRNA synthetase alpha subunit